MEVADRAAPQLELQPRSISDNFFFANNKPLQTSVLDSLSWYFPPLISLDMSPHAMGVHSWMPIT